MINWRKGILNLFYFIAGNATLRNLRYIKSVESESAEKLKQLQDERLRQLLLHAYKNVPYYKDILTAAGVVKEGKVLLENFGNIPILTKEIIRQQGENLYSRDYLRRKSYTNTSGGSTGEPVNFIQDKKYKEWGMATKRYFMWMLGEELGQREIKLWGSDRDIIVGSLTLRSRLINWFHNTRFFNCYRLNTQSLTELTELNNTFKPKAYWSYMEAALELADFVSRNKSHFHPPEILISTIGPLTEEVRNKIERSLRCKVYNQYGSREVGAIACECKEQKGLHTFPWWNVVEILGEDNKPVEGEEGNVIVTTLLNYSMPLIRYEISDVAVAGGYECKCGRNSFMLKNILGRTLGYFKKPNGSLVHSHFLVQALFFKQWIKRFQVIQTDYNRIIIRVERYAKEAPDPCDVDGITEKTKILMGTDCMVDYEFVDEISRAKSGKYLYTICQVE